MTESVVGAVRAGLRDRGETGAAGRESSRLGLGALLGATFLANVDVAVANIAGPAIRSGLRATGGELEFVVSGYTLAYCVLLVTCARLGQARGYRRMFLAGLGAFTVASAACALAPDAPFLIVARVAAGAAAALMVAQVLTGIQDGFTGQARARALGVYSVALSAGAVAGQSLGGLLISADVLGTAWRPVFAVNVPLGVALLWAAWRYLPGGGRRQEAGRLDLPGVAVLSTATVLLIVPLVLGPGAGWPAWTWIALASSGAAFAGLWFLEKRVAAAGRRPLVDPALLSRTAVSWGLASQAITTGTYFAILFSLALYLQQGLGKSAAYSGLALLSWVAAFGVPGPVLGRLTARTRALSAPVGALLLATGFAALGAALLAGDTNGALLMILLGVSGLGLGTGFTGTLAHLSGSVSAGHAADVSGLFNTATRGGGVAGTAAFGGLYLALVPGGSGEPAAVHGFAVLNLVLAGAALAAAMLATVAVRRGNHGDPLETREA